MGTGHATIRGRGGTSTSGKKVSSYSPQYSQTTGKDKEDRGTQSYKQAVENGIAQATKKAAILPFNPYIQQDRVITKKEQVAAKKHAAIRAANKSSIITSPLLNKSGNEIKQIQLGKSNSHAVGIIGRSSAVSAASLKQAYRYRQQTGRQISRSQDFKEKLANTARSFVSSASVAEADKYIDYANRPVTNSTNAFDKRRITIARNIIGQSLPAGQQQAYYASMRAFDAEVRQYKSETGYSDSKIISIMKGKISEPSQNKVEDTPEKYTDKAFEAKLSKSKYTEAQKKQLRDTHYNKTNVVTDVVNSVKDYLAVGDKVANVVMNVKPNQQYGKLSDKTTGNTFREALNSEKRGIIEKPITKGAEAIAMYYGGKLFGAGLSSVTAGVRLGTLGIASKISNPLLKSALTTLETVVEPGTAGVMLYQGGKEVRTMSKAKNYSGLIDLGENLLVGGAGFKRGQPLGMLPYDAARVAGRKEIALTQVVKDSETLAGRLQFPHTKKGETPTSFMKTFETDTGTIKGFHASQGTLGNIATVRGEIARPTDNPGLYMSGFKTGTSPWFLRLGNKSDVPWLLDSVIGIRATLSKAGSNPKATAIQLVSAITRQPVKTVKGLVTKVLGESQPLKPTIHSIEFKGVSRMPKDVRGKTKLSQEFMQSEKAKKEVAYLTSRLERDIAGGRAEAEAVLTPGTTIVKVPGESTTFVRFKGRLLPIDEYITQSVKLNDGLIKTTISKATKQKMPNEYRKGIKTGLKTTKARRTTEARKPATTTTRTVRPKARARSVSTTAVRTAPRKSVERPSVSTSRSNKRTTTRSTPARNTDRATTDRIVGKTKGSSGYVRRVSERTPPIVLVQKKKKLQKGTKQEKTFKAVRGNRLIKNKLGSFESILGSSSKPTKKVTKRPAVKRTTTKKPAVKKVTNKPKPVTTTKRRKTSSK